MTFTVKQLKVISCKSEKYKYIKYSFLLRMHWFLKVTFIIIYLTVYTNCLPLGNHSQQSVTQNKRYIPIHKRNSIYKSDVRNHPKLHNRDLSLDALGNRLRRIYRDFSKSENSISHDKSEIKRGVNIGIHLNLPTTKKYDAELERLEDILAKALEERLTDAKPNATDCPSCEEEEEIPVKLIVKPAYGCDEWNSKHRICILERNIGDTVTFYLSTGKHGGSRHSNVTWKKEFHLQNSVDRKAFIIQPENSPENIIIGRKGYELRVSPITETDVEYNMFSATLPSLSSFSKVYFMIRIVPIDLGFVYVGETIELSLRNYVSLPMKSTSFKWYMEKDGEHGTLPSNMKVSFTGSSIRISELRQEQEGILACSVYTNHNFLATKKRFLLKDLTKNNDVLQSRPNHTLIFKEMSIRDKRDPKALNEYPNIFAKLFKHKQKRNIADEIEKELLNPKTTRNQYAIPSRSLDDSLEMGISHEESQVPEDYQNKFPEISEGDDDDYSSKPKQVDISIYSGLAGDEKTMTVDHTMYNLQPTTEGLPPQTEAPIDELIAPMSVNQYQSEDMPINQENIANIQANKNSQFIQKFQNRHPFPPIHQNNVNLKLPSEKTHQGKNKNLDIQTKIHEPYQKSGNSEIILNIDKMSTPRKLTAEDQISKLISSCSSDFECSESAVCITPNLQNVGFCKCLSGSIGVGIFCREEIWLSDSKFDVELHNPDYV